MDESKETPKVTKLDLIKITAGFILFFVDVAFDIYAAVEIYQISSTEYFVAAIIFIILPAVITNLISWLCYQDDNDTSVISGFFHFFLLGYIKRIFDLLCCAVEKFRGRNEEEEKTGKNSMKKFSSWYADAAMIGMMEALLESDPQAIIQLSRIIPGKPNDNFNFGAKRTLSAVFSFVSVGFAIASYHVALRMPQSQKNKICKIGYLFHWIWHLLITASRVISLGCLVTVLPAAALIGGLIHVIIAILYLRIPGIGPERQLGSFWRGLGLHLLISFAYLFYAIPVCDGPSHRFYISMYSIFFVENLAALLYWYFQLSNTLALIVVIFTVCCFILGIFFMLMYYINFHPSKTVSFKSLCSYTMVPRGEVPVDEVVPNE